MAERKGKIGEMLSPGREAGVGRGGGGTGGEGALKGGTRKGSECAGEGTPGPCSCSEGANCVPKILCVLAAFSERSQFCY